MSGGKPNGTPMFTNYKEVLKMTVRELINLLEGMDDEQEVLFKPNNSWYPKV